MILYFFFSSRRRHTRSDRDWSSDVCSSDLRAGSTCRAHPLAAGLRPGGAHGTYFQPFVIDRAARLGMANALEILSPAPRRLEVDRDFAPHGGSPSGEVTGEVVFAGHGGTGAYGSRDDWAGVDVHGKIVLVLDGPSDGGRVTRLEKLIAAKGRGAAAPPLVGDTLPSPPATAPGGRIVSAPTPPQTPATFAPRLP